MEPSLKKHIITTRDSIIQFFLHLYKIQLGADVVDEEEVELVPASPNDLDLDRIYTFRVSTAGKFKSRRMSIAPLGENLANKSTCFKVIYDDLLVIKIPPFPITDFEEYIDSIHAESRIADELKHDIKCVTPSISVLLKKIPSLYVKEDLSPDQLEDKYVAMLRRRPNLQNHLRIGSSFVFFMSLSKYYFFDYIIKRIHNTKTEMMEEISHNFDALWDVNTFRQVYGEQNISKFTQMNRFCLNFESRLSELLKAHGLDTSIPAYQRKEFIKHYLAKKHEEPEDIGMPAAILQEFDKLCTDMTADFRQDIEAYRSIIAEYIQKKNLSSNSPKFRGIITNFLNVLLRLKNNGVAIRDLKPDNIFIVRDGVDSDHYLTVPEDYSLGLIDFETAVYLKGEGGKIMQPLQTGTPSYATPSNLSPNDILEELFKGSFKKIFYFQDWYAAIGIIYNVMTGDILFKETGKLLPEIILVKRKASLQNQPLSDLFKNNSWVFWHSAVREFNKKTSLSKTALEATEINIQKDVAEMLLPELQKIQGLTIARMKYIVHAQRFFKNEKAVNNLLISSYEAIWRQLSKWEKGQKVPKTSPEVRNEILALLRELAEIKLQLKQYEQMEKKLTEEHPTMTVYQLLELFFCFVMRFMYRESWTNRIQPRIGQDTLFNN
jgi:serine/threonine protein kinase